jgi:predicted DNA-binding transcriptional regulator YafY
MFTEEEALGLALGLMAARGLGLSGVAPAVEGALAKLERVMPEPLATATYAAVSGSSAWTGSWRPRFWMIRSCGLQGSRPRRR